MKILEVVYQIQATDEQTSDILNTANHVERNLKEAQRLLRTKAAFLDSHEYDWVILVIRDTREALQSIAKLIEPARVEKMTRNEIGMMTKTYWAFKFNPQARDKHAMLNVCHQTLMVVITRLLSANLPSVSVASDQVTLPPPYDHNMEKLWTWQDRRRGRRRNISNLHEMNSDPGLLAPIDRQDFELPPLDSDSYSTTNAIMDSQRGHPARQITNLNIASPSHLRSSSAPYSHDGWPHASHSDISLPAGGIDSPSAPTRPTHPRYPSRTPPAPKLQIYEMSAVQPTLAQQQQLLPQLLGREIVQPRRPTDPTTPPHYLPTHPSLSLSTRPTSTPHPRTGPAPTDQPLPSTPKRDPPKHTRSPNPAPFPPHRSELEAVGGSGTRRAAVHRSWASESGPDVARVRPGAGDRVGSGGGGREGGVGLRGSWLAYQTSLRGSRCGREGGGCE